MWAEPRTATWGKERRRDVRAGRTDWREGGGGWRRGAPVAVTHDEEGRDGEEEEEEEAGLRSLSPGFGR